MAIPNTPDHYHAMVVLGGPGVASSERKTWNLYFRNDTGGGSEGAADAIAARLQAFLDYNVPGEARSVGQYIAANVARAAELRVYDLGEAGTPPNPRTPFIRALNLAAPAVDDYTLPPDCAIRLTIRAADAPLTAQSLSNPKVRPRRRTGGFYFGPLTTATLQTVGLGPRGNVRAGVVAGLAQACKDLATASVLQAVRWVLLSPTTGDSWEVTDGFVDEEFDTIRKRGLEQPARTVWAL